MPLFRKPVSFRRVIKSTETQSVSSSTTLVDDDTLFIPLAAGASYAITGMILYTSNSTADFKAGFKDDAAYTSSKLFFDKDGFGDSIADFADGAQDVATTGSDAVPIFASCTTDVSQPAPTLTLQWAQNTSNAVETKVLIGSWLEVRLVT